MIGFTLTEEQEAELLQIAGEIEGAYQDGTLSGDERQRLLDTMADCGLELPQPPAEPEVDEAKLQERLAQYMKQELFQRDTNGGRKGDLMPNNITNQITFGSDSGALAAFQRMLHDVRMEGQPLGSIDFNKLLPMPKELDMEAGSRTDRGLKLVQEYHHALTDLEQQKPALSLKDYAEAVRQCEGLYRGQRMADPAMWALGEQAYNNIQRFGSPTWYGWCTRNWGTKWNAYGFQPLEQNSDTMEFFTAWNSVPKIITLLSRKYPEQTITYRWADEDIGHNVGEMTLKGGEVIDSNVPEGGSREAYEMAAEIMDTDLSDYDLCLTADGSSYEYRDPNEALAEDKASQEPSSVHTKQAKAPKKKRGAKGQDR